ncbi:MULTISPECIES: AzlD domain-containing protein [Caldilinea]|jgi:branched-subunit amino acid transport protein|uniref:AzlD domain-containing protein n=2 Tax=Caldilinea aerophila TaxID=133453 RepID=I0I5R8_CALAS|nr:MULTISPECIES: AzlD domain-containing protein [Caldilinea]MBO9393563.1 AzlD domain-containing protein [Caldilinea sp.]BAM00606.1 hypothetical protein CLDAP_25660 [Caldilinea aerophila DSM 14535 = NBRC 104270]GIV71961.1 MAG: hypothetical protein KatS3mg049_0517 [Caldilinea sp.]
MTFYEIVLVAGMATVTFLIRWPTLALVSRITLPKPLVDALQFIPPAVLAAIVVPAMLTPNGALDLHPGNAYLIAGVVSGLLAWRTHNLLATILFGMTFFLIWRWLW